MLIWIKNKFKGRQESVELRRPTFSQLLRSARERLQNAETEVEELTARQVLWQRIRETEAYLRYVRKVKDERLRGTSQTEEHSE